MYPILILTASVTTLLLDMIWLGYLAKDMYMQHIGSVLRLNAGALAPQYYAAAVVYIAIIAGLFIFVLPDTLDQPLYAAYKGMWFGIITYAIYDFTNLAILNHWSLTVSCVDALWGGFLCGMTCYITAQVYALLK